MNVVGSVSQHASANEPAAAAVSSSKFRRPGKNSGQKAAHNENHNEAAVHREGSGNTNKSNETAYLHQKLRDVLDRQVQADEQHQLAMVTTRQLLRRLYDENASLRNIVTAAEFRKRNDGRVSRTDDPPTVTDAEANILSHRINVARRSHNRFAHELKKLQQTVRLAEKEEEEALKVLTATAGTLDPASMYAALSGNNSIALRIQRIERQLNEVLSKQKVLRMITEGYREQILALESERTEYDTHIRCLEQQYTDRHRDHLNLITLFQNTQHDYETVVGQRTAYTQHVKKQRRMKEKLLVDRRHEVQQAILETERHGRALEELQMQLDEEAQRMEEVEAQHQELLERVARQRSAETFLISGGVNSSGTAGSGQDAEKEEQLSAYHIAVQQLLKETKTDSRHTLVPVFQAEMEQYDQLRAQVEMKRERLEKLDRDVHRLRSKWSNAKVSASAKATVPHTSVTLEEELKVFLQEAELELAALVREEEGRRLLLRRLAQQGNRVSQLTSAYRPDIPIRPMREIDPHLPIHFTALTQKLLSLADETTIGAGARGLAPPAAAVAIVVPENNLRVPLLKSHGDGANATESKSTKKGKIATMASSAAAAVLQQRVGASGRRDSTESSRKGQSFHLTEEDLQHDAPPVVNSDLDEEEWEEEDGTSSQGSQAGGMGYGDASNALAGGGGGASLTMGNSAGASLMLPGTAALSTTSPLPPRGPTRKRPASANVGGGGKRNASALPGGRGSSVVSDEPLQRNELKRVSMAIKEREKKRIIVEERRRASLAKEANGL